MAPLRRKQRGGETSARNDQFIESPSELSDLTSEALATIARALEEIGDLRERSSTLAAHFNQLRAELQHQREERDLMASLELGLESQDEEAPPDAAESYAFDRLQQATRFERSLADFASVLHSAQRQLGAGNQLPDSENANYLAVKMAELRAREDERQRFARDIHDGPAQAFANAIIGLEFIERALRSDRDNVIEESLAEIDRIKRTMREGLTEIRRFIFDHRPTMLTDRGLGPTLNHYVQSYQSIFPLMITIDIDAAVGRLDPDRELTAFRIIQESIQNASKHARASEVDVRIKKNACGSISITVTDNGRGFDPDRVRSHAMGGSGLMGMQERIDLVGGELEIRSERGIGTVVEITLPPARDAD